MKEIWCDFRLGKKENLNLVEIDNYCIRVVSYEQYISAKDIKGKFAIEVSSTEEIDCINDNDIAIIKNEAIELLEYANRKNKIVAQEYFVYDKESMISAAESESDYVVVKLRDVTNIPLELILATSQGKMNHVIKYVNNYEEAEIAFGTMEKGVNGVVISTEIVDEIIELVGRLNNKKAINIKKCKIKNITHLGMGARMCIDTIEILEKNEGCLVGSTIYGGILVSSETHYLPYMNLRPFRVNAGGIHSYVLSEQDKTMYMSEIESGSKVMIINTNGDARLVTVGRAKIEKRPMIKIAAYVEGMDISIIVQDDWHIRVFDGDGNAVSIMDLKIEDEILGYCNVGARHVGMRIDEEILER